MIKFKKPNFWKNIIIPKTKKAKYDGICFDLERGGPSGNPREVDPVEFKKLFKIVKNNNLKVMVTISWFGQGTWGFTNMPGLTKSFMEDDNIDICAIGEGEQILAEVVDRLIKNNGKKLNSNQLKLIDGIAFTESKTQILNTEIKPKEFAENLSLQKYKEKLNQKIIFI